jgi:P27 family predicted phage terminase small subunit
MRRFESCRPSHAVGLPQVRSPTEIFEPKALEPERPAEPPYCPDFLVGHARAEWDRIAGGLHRLGLLSQLDVMPLASYCVAYARWREAEELLAEMAARDQVTSGMLVKNQSGDARINPLAKISRLAAADMVRYAGEFGFSPAARARIAAGPGSAQPASKFDGLFGG